MKKKIEFAPTLTIETSQPEVDELLRHFAVLMKEPDETEEDWLAYVFVSDESCIGNFIYDEPELSQLRKRVGIPDLSPRDSICEVASLMRSMKRPQ